MSERNDGGPDYALSDDGPSAETLRDTMAIAAARGMLTYGQTHGRNGEYIARKSYEIADAMLAERAKVKP